MRFKKKLNISSLSAAICNVAVFKGMKERQFRDEIHISYSEEGVILQAINQQQWERAHRFVDDFLKKKKIALLTFGFDKEVYEQLIIRGLKDYTRKMKDHNMQCPYINIIHYQKLRKSCQYMDKEHYVQPLKDWERKNKKNPNFAFLIVDPKQRYEQVKKNLLQFLLKKEVKFQQHYFTCLYFLMLFFNSNVKEEIKQNFEKKFIELSLEANPNFQEDNEEEEEFKVRIANFTDIKLGEFDYKIVKYSKHLVRLGLEFISAKQIETQIKNVKNFITTSATSLKGDTVSVNTIFESLHKKMIKKYGDDYCVIPFKKSEKQKYSAVIKKYIALSTHKSIEQIASQIQKNMICSYDDIEFLSEINPVGYDQRGYKIHKVCINDCPFMLYQYERIAVSQLQTFLMYIEQLKTYYCTYLVRFYGITVKYDNVISKKGKMPASMTLEEKIQRYSFYLVFDYHHRTIEQMAQNDMIVDNFQIAQMVLQILYLINFLHTHEEPRALGSIRINQVCWPLKIALPYLGNNEDLNKQEEKSTQKGFFLSQGEGFEGDVKITGQLMKYLLDVGEENPKDIANLDDHFGDLLRMMLKESKYERITLSKCITMLEELLIIN